MGDARACQALLCPVGSAWSFTDVNDNPRSQTVNGNPEGVQPIMSASKISKDYAATITAVTASENAQEKASSAYRDLALSVHAGGAKVADIVAALKDVNAGLKIDGDDVRQAVKDVRVSSAGGVTFLSVVGAFYACPMADGDDGERFADYRDVRRFLRSVIDTKGADGKSIGATTVKNLIGKSATSKDAAKGLSALRTTRKTAAAAAAAEKNAADVTAALTATDDATDATDAPSVPSVPSVPSGADFDAATERVDDYSTTDVDALAMALVDALAAGAVLSDEASHALAVALGMVSAF